MKHQSDWISWTIAAPVIILAVAVLAWTLFLAPGSTLELFIGLFRKGG